jgi:two-component system response regulator NreC
MLGDDSPAAPVSDRCPGARADPHAGGSQPLEVVIADNQAVVRSGLRKLLESAGEFVVIAESDGIEAARPIVRQRGPAVLLLDLDGPAGPSLEQIMAVRAESPGTHIVVLSMQQDAGFVREALAAGALTYVPKVASGEELAEALRRAARGETHVIPRLRSWLASDSSRVARNRLTSRETDVLEMIARGHTNTEIALALEISVRTVESHRAHIQQKLGRVSRAQLVAYALERGLIGPDAPEGAG